MLLLYLIWKIWDIVLPRKKNRVSEKCMWENTFKNLIYQKCREMLGCSKMQGKAIGNGLTPKGSNMFAPHRTFQNNFLTPKWKLTCTKIVNDKMDRFSYWYEYVKIHTKIEIRWINVGKTMTEYYLWTRLFFVTLDSETTSYLTLDRETQMTSQEGRSSAFTQQKHIRSDHLWTFEIS